MVDILLLILSVFLGAGRSVFSKKMSSGTHKEKRFYVNLGIFFFTAAVVTYILNLQAFKGATLTTVFYGLVFGATSFLAQWCYTIALNRGATSICAMVYSMGFIIPTISGALFWNEPFGFTSALGMAIAISSIVVSAFSGEKGEKLGKGFIIPNVIAMLCSGFLGVLQKTHQSSADKENLEAFLIIGFVLAAVLAFVYAMAYSRGKGEDAKRKVKISIYPFCAGLCFGLVSILNTLLAGRLPSAIIFPTLNVGVMMACLIFGMIIFKERPNKKQILAFCLGIVTILVLSF